MQSPHHLIINPSVSTSSLISMLLILGLVVGGFVYFLRLAIRKEAEKSRRP